MRRLMIASIAALGVTATAVQAHAMGDGWELTHGRDAVRAETRVDLAEGPATRDRDATRVQIAERRDENTRRPYTRSVPDGALFGSRQPQWGHEGGR